ncbi:hypothetical protein NKH63_27175 [Mesorhizobium sp. M0960]|uniref:hypothetical protein n=1 Tax=Mesorhizobium sp. M0960 TaxID=2957035 RepID=UPI00333758A9
MTSTSWKALSVLMFAIIPFPGCSNDPESPENKRIYSVLQHQEFELRQQNNRANYFFGKRVMDTEINTIAFPLAGEAKGYVVFYATPEEGGLILSVPQQYDDISLTKQTLEAIVDKGLISKPLEIHLASRAH